MQPYMLDVLAEVKADAFIFDTFSNPDAELIRERLMPFIDRLIAAHPATPLIFQRTIYRERRSFDTVLDAKERAKADNRRGVVCENPHESRNIKTFI